MYNVVVPQLFPVRLIRFHVCPVICCRQIMLENLERVFWYQSPENFNLFLKEIVYPKGLQVFLCLIFGPKKPLCQLYLFLPVEKYPFYLLKNLFILNFSGSIRYWDPVVRCVASGASAQRKFCCVLLRSIFQIVLLIVPSLIYGPMSVSSFFFFHNVWVLLNTASTCRFFSHPFFSPQCMASFLLCLLFLLIFSRWNWINKFSLEALTKTLLTAPCSILQKFEEKLCVLIFKLHWYSIFCYRKI